MDEHLTEVKNISDMVEEVNCGIHEDILVYYTLQNLPSQYYVFRCTHMSNLPSYDDLEAKLLGEEISLSWNAEEKHSEALLVSRNNYRQGQPFCVGQSSVFTNNMMGGSSYTAQQHRPQNYSRGYQEPSYQNAQNYQF